MNYLELCQRVRLECGLAGAGPTTTQGQVGQLGRIVQWVDTAWEELQNHRSDWWWMKEEFNINIPIGYDTVPSSLLPNSTYWKDSSGSYINIFDRWYEGSLYTTVKGKLEDIRVTSGGSGYSSAPTVVITTATGDPGSGASGTAYVNGGVVYKVVVDDGGSEYTSNPTITFTGGGGSGAAAESSVSWASPVGYIDYQMLYNENINLPTLYHEQPAYWTTDRNSDILFSPKLKPDYPRGLKGHYIRKAVSLNDGTANGLTPDIPDAYHMLIVWKAMEMFMSHEEEPSLFNYARAKGDKVMSRLDSNFRTIGGSYSLSNY